MALAERLHVDADEVLDWPYEKLQRWLVYDEVNWMIRQVREASKNMTDEEVVAVVRAEQESKGWVGVVNHAKPQDDDLI